MGKKVFPKTQKQEEAKAAKQLKKLTRAHKSAQKGAERELRLDAKFLARKQAEKRKAEDEVPFSTRSLVDAHLPSSNRPR